jgi:hypothetical protein
VVGLSLAETITISRHLRAPEVHAYVNVAPLTDLRNPETPAPTAADASGRSAQIFVMQAIARKGSAERRASARGQDIYAITAPIVVEAMERILNGHSKITGAVTAGEAFDAHDFLNSLPLDITVETK